MHNDVKEYMLMVNEEIVSFSKEINHKKDQIIRLKIVSQNTNLLNSRKSWQKRANELDDKSTVIWSEVQWAKTL